MSKNYLKGNSPIWREIQARNIPFSQVLGVTSHGVWGEVSSVLYLWNGIEKITAQAPVNSGGDNASLTRFDVWENSQHDIFLMTYNATTNARWIERSAGGTGAFARVITLPACATRCLPRSFLDLGLGKHLYFDYSQYGTDKNIYYSSDYGVNWSVIWAVDGFSSVSVDATAAGDVTAKVFKFNCASDVEATTMAAAFTAGRVFQLAGSATTANNGDWTIAAAGATAAASKVTVTVTGSPTAGANTGGVVTGKPYEAISHFHGAVYNSTTQSLYIFTGDNGPAYAAPENMGESSILVCENLTEFLKGSAGSSIDYLEKWGLKDKDRTGLDANYCLNNDIASGKPNSQRSRVCDMWMEGDYGYIAMDSAAVADSGGRVYKINLAAFKNSKVKCWTDIGGIAGEGWTWSICNGYPIFGIATKPAVAGTNLFDNYVHLYSLNAERTKVIEVYKSSKYYNSATLLYSYPMGYCTFLDSIIAKSQTGPTRAVVGDANQQDMWQLSWISGRIEPTETINDPHAATGLGGSGFASQVINLMSDPGIRAVTSTVLDQWYREHPHTYYQYLTQEASIVRTGFPFSMKLLKGSGGSSKLKWAGQILPGSVSGLCVGRQVTASAWFYLLAATEATQIPAIGIFTTDTALKIASMSDTTHILVAGDHTAKFKNNGRLIITDSLYVANNRGHLISADSTYDGTNTSITIGTAITIDHSGYVIPTAGGTGYVNATYQQDFAASQYDDGWHHISITKAIPATTARVGIIFFAAGSNSGTIVTEQPVYVSNPVLCIGKFVGEAKVFGVGEDAIPNGLQKVSRSRYRGNYGTLLPSGYEP